MFWFELLCKSLPWIMYIFSALLMGLNHMSEAIYFIGAAIFFSINKYDE